MFHVSNLSVLSFRIFLLMYTGSLSPGKPGRSDRRHLPSDVIARVVLRIARGRHIVVGWGRQLRVGRKLSQTLSQSVSLSVSG